MKHNTDCFCGIDFQRDYFSAVQYSLKERAVTLISIQPFPAEKQTEEWKVWRRELKKSRSRLRLFCPSISSSIPAQYAVIKLLTIDANEPSVEDALKWELTQHLVGEPDDFVFDVQEMVGIATERTRTFLLAAYRRTLVEQTADMIRNSGFEPLAIGLDIFGLINVFEANYRECLAVPCLLVHCEETTTKLSSPVAVNSSNSTVLIIMTMSLMKKTSLPQWLPRSNASAETGRPRQFTQPVPGSSRSRGRRHFSKR